MSHTIKIKASPSKDSFAESPIRKSHLKNTHSTTLQKNPNLALQLNPSLCRSSELAQRISTGALSDSRQELGSTRSRLSTASKYQRNSKVAKPLTPKMDPYYSPDPKSSKGMVYNKSNSNLGSSTYLNNGSTMCEMSIVRPHPMSETLVQRFEDMKNTYEYKRNLGVEVYDKTKHRQEIEKQVKALEMRVQKLCKEEQDMIKKIDETQKKTEKILDLKRKHHVDLAEKLERKRQQEEKREQRRQEILNERAQTKKNIKTSTMNKIQKNINTANEIKSDNAQAAMQKKENQDKHLDQAHTNKRKIHGAHDEFREKYYGGKERQREFSNQKYIDRLEDEKRKADELTDKYYELERTEQVVLQRLNNTYSLHKSKVDQLGKAFSLKVSATEGVQWQSDDDGNELEQVDLEDGLEAMGQQTTISSIKKSPSVSKFQTASANKKSSSSNKKTSSKKKTKKKLLTEGDEDY